MPPDPVTSAVFAHLFSSVADEMGITLERTAYSPNIKERRDHSCALFDERGVMAAQAAHIPVHLGAFPLLMEEMVPRFDWRPGDVVICNDPFIGGTHLPDISLVSPVFQPDRDALAGFVASRAHHADVGGAFPGSLASTTELYQEGIIIPPVYLARGGVVDPSVMSLICRNSRTAEERRGDFSAQLAANETGVLRFQEIIRRYGMAEVSARLSALFAAGRRAVETLLAELPSGTYAFEDSLDDDGHGSGPVTIRAAVTVKPESAVVDFTGSGPQCRGSINATRAVTHSAVYYCFLCLLGEDVPLNQGCLEPVRLILPEGSVVSARPPAAVAAGNVETSQRIVDVVFGCLAQAAPERVPAASQGTMNNLTLGGAAAGSGPPWAYYETMGGGAGGSPAGPGSSGIHTHMSNTRNTPVEALEYHYPLLVREYAIRRDSGGPGRFPGGDGLTREIELLEEATVSLVAERREQGPYGLTGGGAGAPGRDQVQLPGEAPEDVPAKFSRRLPPGARIRVSTPGGGGWGEAPDPPDG